VKDKVAQMTDFWSADQGFAKKRTSLSAASCSFCFGMWRPPEISPAFAASCVLTAKGDQRLSGWPRTVTITDNTDREGK